MWSLQKRWDFELVLPAFQTWLHHLEFYADLGNLSKNLNSKIEIDRKKGEAYFIR